VQTCALPICAGLRRGDLPMTATFRSSLVLVGLLAFAAPASAQWTRVTEVTPFDVFSVWANGDTLVAGADTVVFVSTDAGATWRRSAKVGPGVTEIRQVRERNRRIFAGTFGQGVFVSDDLGATWTGFHPWLGGGVVH